MEGNTQPEMNGFDAEQVSSSSLYNRFFPGGKRAELLDQITHLTRFGMMAVNVAGEAGTGKTHLLHAVANSLDTNVITVRTTLLMSSSELLNQILKSVLALRFHHDLPDLPSTTDEKALISIISSYFLRLKDSGGAVVILVDDAHELSEDALEVLLKLVLDKSLCEHLKCVMFSEPYFSNLLSKPSVKEVGAEQVFTLMMPLVDESIIAEYLTFIEATKPDSDRIMYSQSDIRTIYNLTKGNLGQVNSAIRSLLEGSGGTKQARPAFPWQSAALATLVLALTLIAYLYVQESDPGLTADSVEASGVVQIDAVEKSKGDITIPVEEDSTLSGTKATLLEQLRLKQERLKQERSQTTHQVVDKEAVNEASTDFSVVSANKEASLSSDQQLEADRGTHPQVVEPPSKADAVNHKSTLAGQTEVKKDFNIEEANEGYKSNRWIAARPGNFYTIQILGAHSKKNVSHYIDTFSGDKSELAVYEGVLRGQPWYVLIHGNYENRQAAKRAGDRLGLKDVWIRSFSSVQKEMVR
ncbi:AAA family ATPase [Litoribacillus peritrichatus]|uniref:SPOR domain-containing protein n=1 Tax=Litoribacillus peritrichatus TaxID=718191 RepID=A0ABP7MT41_9GAMM